MSLAMGLDFGTTNSAIAASDADGVSSSVVLTRFAKAEGTTETFRSVLYFDPEEVGPDRRPLAVAGPTAIEQYLEADGQGRLLQSLKSYLASRLFKSTSVYGRQYSLEALIGLIVRDLKKGALQQFGQLPERLIVGRPVRFVGTHDEESPSGPGLPSSAEGGSDEEYALSRLTQALKLGGFASVEFEYEPVAAAYHYESRLTHDELVLIADFGGGTSDFCLMRVGPEVRARGRTRQDMLGTEGVALAGDAFDSKIVRNLVAPLLGRGSHYVTQGKRMPVPPWLYSHLERWHHLSFLKTRENIGLLEKIHAGAEEPARISALIHLIENDLGYHLYQCVERAKVALSEHESVPLKFMDGPLRLDLTVTRSDFEQWIAPELAAISSGVDRLLQRTGLSATQVDAVFVTGGTSLVPAVRRLFVERFGAERLRSGSELTSVASGLALRARHLP